jgi:hypothetical protein
MKKATVLALTLGLLAGWGATQAFGIAQFYTQPCTTTAPVGTQFTILINHRNNVDSVYGWQYNLYWDTTILRCDTIKEGPFLSRSGQYSTFFVLDTAAPRRANMLVACTLLGQEPCATGDGNLAKVVFYVRARGSCALHFDSTDTYLMDNNINEIPRTVKDGYFQTPSGVEENKEVRSLKVEVRLKVAPNPFASFAVIPGHEAERFALYDITGRMVGAFRGDRIGEGLKAGVYFLRPEGSEGKPLRVIKLR